MPTKRRIPSGALKRPAPRTLRPTLATLVDAPPADTEDWLFEVKFDGYRLLSHITTQGIRLITRNGHDWTSKLSHLAHGLGRLKLKSGWLDGEIVVPVGNGGTSFQALQNAFESSKTRDIVYFLFDVPFYDGYDLTRVPLGERRAFLEPLLVNATPPIRLSEVFDVAPTDLLSSACKQGLEGIIGKRKASPYVESANLGLDQAQVQSTAGVRHWRMDGSQRQPHRARIAPTGCAQRRRDADLRWQGGHGLQ